MRDLDADGVPVRLYRPDGAAAGRGRAPARRRVRVPRRRRPRRRLPPVREPGRPRRAQRRLPAAARAPVPGGTGRRGHGRWPGWTARRRRYGLDGPTFVHGDSAGGNLALVAALRNPGRFAAVGADLPVPRPDRGLRRRTGLVGVGFDPREAAWYWEQYAATPADLDEPGPRAAAVGPAGHAAADPGRHRRARPAARRGRGPRAAARRAGRRGHWRPATSGRSTGSGATTPVFPMAEALMQQAAAFLADLTADRMTAMRVHLGSDHAGLDLKAHLLGLADRARLRAGRPRAVRLRRRSTTTRCSACGRPRRCAADRADGLDSLGVVIGGSGNGEQMAANKVPGIRCALAWSEQTASLGARAQRRPGRLGRRPDALAGAT